MDENQSYTLIDSGKARKLESFGPYLLARPCPQAVWMPTLSTQRWDQAQASFSRERENQWQHIQPLPSSWHITVAGLVLKIAPTDFGHIGIFPEQKPFWEWISAVIQARVSVRFIPRVLNLFAYSGGATLAAAKAGATVCHLDASKGMVTWARENATLNGLDKAPIRWIIDDVHKFLEREIRRGIRYDAIILDPPTFGRGSKGELFKIEEDIIELLQMCLTLLSNTPLFVLFSCHTPGFSPLVMHHLMTQIFHQLPGNIDSGEMCLTPSELNQTFSVPSGTYARWQATV